MTTPTHTTTPLDLSWVEFSEHTEAACQSPKDCSRQAIYKLVMNCPCRMFALLCEGHKEYELNYWEPFFRSFYHTTCNSCSGEVTDIEVFPIN